MDVDKRFASMWAGTDNRFGPEDFKANEGLAVVC
jgi:hypothetical protein